MTLSRFRIENVTSNSDFALGSFKIPIYLCLDGITWKLFEFMTRWIWKYAIYERGVRLNAVVCFIFLEYSFPECARMRFRDLQTQSQSDRHL